LRNKVLWALGSAPGAPGAAALAAFNF